MSTAAHGEEPSEELNFYQEKSFPGIFAWILSTDHKRIGLMYLVSLLSFFGFGVFLGLTMRIELMFTGETIIGAQLYNQVFTMHGIVMIFLFIIPGLPAVFGNFMLPIMIGAKDVSFPKLNLLSWWLFILGAAIAVFGLFVGEGAADTGWTFYVPYSTETSTNVVLATTAAFVLGFSSILTGLNFVTTIHRLRAPGMSWFRMPLFVWALYATAWIQVLATPIIGITLVMIIVERTLSIGLFTAALGGDPILYEHLFWIYSHPAVYIMIVPAFGVVSEIISTFSRRTIFGYKAIALSSVAIAGIGYLVWGHHMFTSGMADTARIIFSFLTFLVAIPTAIKIFNWVATLYKGSIALEPPMLYALSFIFLFSIGGLTGLFVGTLSLDIHLHDTYFVVGHFHYVMFGGTGFAFFGALHYWFPKMFGKMYSKGPAIAGWALFFVGFNVLYFPMFILGYLGNPRRYYDYLPEYEIYHQISTVGSWILAVGLLIIVINLVVGLFKGKPAGRNPWGGPTLEWQVESPPTLENFHKIPRINHDPYDFERPELQKDLT